MINNIRILMIMKLCSAIKKKDIQPMTGILHVTLKISALTLMLLKLVQINVKLNNRILVYTSLVIYQLNLSLYERFSLGNKRDSVPLRRNTAIIEASPVLM